MTERWTRSGHPVGQPQRPWRLTRRQRVEMEAALAALRAGPHPYRCDCIGPSDDTVAALYALRVRPCDAPTEHDDDYGVPERTLRARAAIALRAELRADEDARCEEALARAGYGEETGATPGDGWDVGYDEGADAAIDALREWPALDRGWAATMPLALWEGR